MKLSAGKPQTKFYDNKIAAGADYCQVIIDRGYVRLRKSDLLRGKELSGQIGNRTNFSLRIRKILFDVSGSGYRLRRGCAARTRVRERDPEGLRRRAFATSRAKIFSSE